MITPEQRAKINEYKKTNGIGSATSTYDRILQKAEQFKNPVPNANFANVDMGKAMEGVSDAPQSTIPKAPQSIVSDVGGDVGEFFQGLGDTVGKTVEGVKDIATNDNFNVAQKSMGVLGKLAGGASGLIGETVVGAGKVVLTQDQEDKIKGIVGGIAQGVAKTDTAKQLVDWYGNLDENNKLIVDSLGGMSALIADVFAPGVVSKTAKTTAEGVKTIAEPLEAGVKSTATTLDNLFTTSQKTLEDRISSTFEKGVKPNLQGQQTLGQAEKYRSDVLSAVKTIENNKNNLKFFDDTGAEVTGRTPKSLQELSEAIDQSKKTIYEQYDNLATQAGENGVKVDTIKIANELDQVINNKGLQLSNPEAVTYAKEVRDRFIKAGELDAKTAQEIIQNYNNSLKAFYRNPTPDGLSKNAVDALMANQMREALDQGIEGLSGAQYQALKSQYAALKTIERDVLRATLRDARKNSKGLIDYTDIFSGGQLVTGLLTLNPSMVASGVTQKGIASWIKFTNDPNKAIEKMFDTASKLDKEARSVPLSTRKQLDTPAEGASNQSIYTPMQMGERAQSTIDATERANPNIKTTPTVVGTGDFGTIYSGIKGDNAINFLIQNKTGEVKGALNHPEIGDIDIIWGEAGSKGYGLAKIAEKHPDAISNIEQVISESVITEKLPDRLVLTNTKNNQRTIIDLQFNDSKKNWLVNSYIVDPSK